MMPSPEHVSTQAFLDSMPGSHPASRNNSLHGGTMWNANGNGRVKTIEEDSLGMNGKHLGPVFARKMASYGQNAFTGAVARKYLTQVGMSLTDVDRVFQEAALLTEHQELVAAAVLQWAKEREATMYTHAFQPLGSEGMRAGSTGQVRRRHRDCRRRP